MPISLQSSSHADAAPSALPPATPKPFYDGVGPLLFGGAALGAMVWLGWVRLNKLPTSGLDWMIHGWFAFAAAMALWGAVQLPRTIRTQVRAWRHPHEPWHWDHAWRREMVDSKLSYSSLLGELALLLLLTVTMAALAGGGLWLALTSRHWPSQLAGGAFSLAILFGGFWRGQLQFARLFRRWRLRRRYGQLRLRLPRIPLELGTQARVELVGQHALPQLGRIRASLRRVRVTSQWEGSFVRDAEVTVHHLVEHEQVQVVAVEASAPDWSAAVMLDLPSPEPETSTWLGHRGHQVYWHLQLTSDVPARDLDTTFLLPVYWVAGAATR